MHDLICFSHMRWGRVYQRPHHLMSRAARGRRVWFVEEPILGAAAPRLQRSVTPEGVEVCVPHVPAGLSPQATAHTLAALLEQLVMVEGIDAPLAWLYTPTMLSMVDAVAPRGIIYDCMDELSVTRFGSFELRLRERALLSSSSLVFTSSRSLYESRRSSHPRVHLFPSSVDSTHFARARAPGVPEPEALQGLPSPRLCWCGVVDQRMDLPLLAEVARRRPMWSFVMIGPVSRLDPSSLPSSPNLYWLGARDYADLPAYLAHVDVGIMPFARNEATRFLSPTKTPEYLAAGLPVVSTSIQDVVDTYGTREILYMADEPEAFVAACERAMAERADPERLRRIDSFLGEQSWDDTWIEMDSLLQSLARAPTSVAQSAARSAR